MDLTVDDLLQEHDDDIELPDRMDIDDILGEDDDDDMHKVSPIPHIRRKAVALSASIIKSLNDDEPLDMNSSHPAFNTVLDVILQDDDSTASDKSDDGDDGDCVIDDGDCVIDDDGKEDASHVMIINESFDRVFHEKPVSDLPQPPSHFAAEFLFEQDSFFKISELPELVHSKYGVPCSIVSSSVFIAIGTSVGFVLLFDHFRSLKHIMESKEDLAVTTMAFSIDGSKLVSGHASGALNFWDLAAFRLLKRVSDLYSVPLFTIKFFHSDNLSLISEDVLGNVHLLNLKYYLFWNLDRQLLFNSKKKIPIFLDILVPNKSYPHCSDRFGLFVISLDDTIAIVAVEPTVKVIFKFEKPSNSSGALTCFAWHPLDAYNAGSDSDKDFYSNPVLIISCGDVVVSYQIYASKVPDPVSNQSVLKIRMLNKQTLSHEIFSMRWMNSEVLALLTESHSIILLNGVDLTSFSSPILISELHMTSLNLGNYHYFHNSLCTISTGALLLLGLKSCWQIALLSWEQRTRSVLSKSGLIKGLQLALSFLRGTAAKPINLPVSSVDRHARMVPRLIHLFIDALETQLARNNSDEISLYCDIAIEYVIAIGSPELIFSMVLESFNKAHSAKVLIDRLEIFIGAGQIKWVSDIVLIQMIDQAALNNRLPQLETCLLCLDAPKQLSQFGDLINLIKSLAEKRLFRALMYFCVDGNVYQFATPIEEILSSNPTSDELYLLLVFIYQTLHNNNFPSGKKCDEPNLAKLQILKTLFCGDRDLSILLNHDAHSTLAVFAIAFESKTWITPDFSHQTILDTLTKSNNQDSDAFFSFCLSVCSIDGPLVQAQEFLIRKIVNSYLSKPASSSAESKLMKVFHVQPAASVVVTKDVDVFLKKAKENHWVRFAAYLYSQGSHYEDVFRCYLSSDEFSTEVFIWLFSTLPLLKDEGKNLLIKAVENNIKRLIEVNPVEAAKLFSKHLNISHNDVLKRLKDSLVISGPMSTWGVITRAPTNS